MVEKDTKVLTTHMTREEFCEDIVQSLIKPNDRIREETRLDIVSRYEKHRKPTGKELVNLFDYITYPAKKQWIDDGLSNWSLWNETKN